MPTRLPSARTAADACPGVLTPHHAADGELVRVRVPGGLLTVPALRALASLAAVEADGRVGLTSRANVQLRSLSAARLDTVAGHLAAAGLLPDAAHERVRNVLASPLPGRLPGALDDVDDLTAALDDGLRARPALAGLPGRFLFALDDGRGDLAAERADLRLVALGAGRYGLDVAGAGGPVLARDDVVRVALDVAEAFLAARDGEWRIAELGAERVLPPGPRRRFQHDHVDVLAPGLVEQVDGRFAVVAVAPLGLLDGDALEALAACAQLADDEAGVRLTPWRRVAIADLELPAALAARELLAAAGLVLAPGTGWDRLTACAGRPGCAKSLTDVHADARAMVAGLPAEGVALHLAGCDRCCGAPAGATRLVATGIGTGIGDGYREEAP